MNTELDLTKEWIQFWLNCQNPKYWVDCDRGDVTVTRKKRKAHISAKTRGKRQKKREKKAHKLWA